MNNLILEILPDIEKIAKKVGRLPDDQNDLVQYTVLECYKYAEIVQRLHREKRLNAWIYSTVKREYMKMVKRPVLEMTTEIADVVYSDNLEELKQYLPEIDRLWIRAYIECDGKYIEIQRRKGIHQETASERMKSIIEKCKKLKSILY